MSTRRRAETEWQAGAEDARAPAISREGILATAHTSTVSTRRPIGAISRAHGGRRVAPPPAAHLHLHRAHVDSCSCSCSCSRSCSWSSSRRGACGLPVRVSEAQGVLHMSLPNRCTVSCRSVSAAAQPSSAASAVLFRGFPAHGAVRAARRRRSVHRVSLEAESLREILHRSWTDPVVQLRFMLDVVAPVGG